jgi:hypothetical protein
MTTEWEQEVLWAIRYEVENKLGKATRMTTDEPAAPLRDNVENSLMGKLQSRTQKQDRDTEGYQNN